MYFWRNSTFLFYLNFYAKYESGIKSLVYNKGGVATLTEGVATLTVGGYPQG